MFPPKKLPYDLVPLKLEVMYGMSTTKRSFRPHLIDPSSYVKVFPDRPELTEYCVRWYCKAPSTKTPLRLMRTSPIGVELCSACLEAKKNREYWASRGITRETIRQARTDDKMMAYIRATMQGMPMRTTEQGPAPF